MAIASNTTPGGTLNFIGNPVIFTFTMTGIESPTEIRRFGYQLLDGTGAAIGPVESYLAQEAVQFPLNFQDDLYPFLKTAYPSNCGALRLEPEMEFEFKLRYWELVFNRDTCQTTVENSTDSSTYKVLNSADQFWGYPTTGGDTFIIQTLYPEHYNICKEKCISYYVWGTGTVRLQPYYGLTATAFQDIPFGAGLSLPVSATNLASVLDLDTKLMTSIGIEVNGNEYTRLYFGECCGPKMVFQTAGGGYATIFMDDEEALTINSSYTEVYTFQPKTSNQAPYTTSVRMEGGRRIFNKEANRLITYTKIIYRDELRDLRFYEDFLSSGNYYLEFESVQGILNPTVPQLIRFLPNGGNIKYFKNGDYYKLTMTGKINQGQALPNYAI